MGAPSISLQKTVAYAPKAGALLSLLGSGYIVHDCLRKLKTRHQPVLTNDRRCNIFNRLMIGMSVGDIMYSISFFAGTWPMPEGTPNVWGAMGTIQSCTFFGFLTQAGVTGVLYNASLAVYYLLRIRKGWPESKIEKVAEKWFHIVPIGFGIISQAVLLAFQQYNSTGFVCYVQSSPRGCKETWKFGSEEGNCVRGDNSWLFRWFLSLGPKVATILFVAALLFLVHRSVLVQERRALRFSARRFSSATPSQGGPHYSDEMAADSATNNSSSSMRRASSSFSELSIWSTMPTLRLSRKLAVQSYFYVGALYVTYLPPLFYRLYEVFTNTTPYWFTVVLGILLPLQGAWNVLVYLRPRYLQAREKRRHQDDSARLSVFGAISYAIREGDLNEEEGDEDIRVVQHEREGGALEWENDGEGVNAGESKNAVDIQQGNHVEQQQDEDEEEEVDECTIGKSSSVAP